MLFTVVLMLSSCGTSGNSNAGKTDDGVLRFEDGMSQPVVNYADPGTPNADSDIIRYCVYG